MFDECLTEDNFLLYAMHHYDNPQCTTVEEFTDDLRRFLYIKKLLLRYHRNRELKERLILNHLIVLYNVFNQSTTKMLFFRVDRECWIYLITFLTYLKRMPESLPDYGIMTSSIQLDEKITETLQKI